MARLSTGFVFVALLLAFSAHLAPLGGCTAVQRVPGEGRANEAFLELRVEPETAEIYVDDEYKGEVRGWAKGILPLPPGEHRLKVTADGYITERFDVRIGTGETKRLTLEMEPRLEEFAED